MKKFTIILLALTLGIGICTEMSAQKYKTVEKSGRRYHWLKWTGGKIYKAEKRAERNESLDKGEEVVYFVVKAEELAYYKNESGEYGYKVNDMQDVLDFNVSKTIAGIILSNFESSIDKGTKIGEGARRTEIHTSIGTLKKKVTVSGILPIKEHWEKVIYKNDDKKETKIKMARVYSMNKNDLEVILQKASKHVGLTSGESNAVSENLFDSMEEGNPEEETNEEINW
ncbi:MAG: hypothetical protein JEZ09_02275 [Salinivirgaceae bacterium]|nr:hypothetical protein [Salinivirgaceae bacterium]